MKNKYTWGKIEKKTTKRERGSEKQIQNKTKEGYRKKMAILIKRNEKLRDMGNIKKEINGLIKNAWMTICMYKNETGKK